MYKQTINDETGLEKDELSKSERTKKLQADNAGVQITIDYLLQNTKERNATEKNCYHHGTKGITNASTIENEKKTLKDEKNTTNIRLKPAGQRAFHSSFPPEPPSKIPLYPGIVGIVVLLLLGFNSDSPWIMLLLLFSLLYTVTVHIVNNIREENYKDAKVTYELEKQHYLGRSRPTIISTRPHYVAVQESERTLTIDEQQIAFGRIFKSVLVVEKHRTNDKANAYLLGRMFGGPGGGTYMALSTQNRTITTVKGVDIYLKHYSSASRIQSAASGLKEHPDFMLRMDPDESTTLHKVICEIVRTNK